MIKIDADSSQIEQLFPAFIAVDTALAITAVGPAVKRLLPESAIGEFFLEHFESEDQIFAEYPYKYFHNDSRIEIQARSNGLKLQGVALSVETGLLLALRPSVDQFFGATSGILISDFALDDPTVHGLLMFSLHRALVEDQRQVALELAYERQKSIDLLNRISRIAGFISHDFNNFLSIIRLNCD